tara:strand:- start:182 stop:547 length:366 start_codon:yes stop_codon:yes gene_type:complete
MGISVDLKYDCEESKKELNSHGWAIGCFMMAIGMNEISEKNYREVYARLVILNASQLGKEPAMSLETVKALIGSKFSGRHINMMLQSRAKWSTRMLKNTIEYIADEEAKPSKKKKKLEVAK